MTTDIKEKDDEVMISLDGNTLSSWHLGMQEELLLFLDNYFIGYGINKADSLRYRF